MNPTARLSLGPLLYSWPRQQMLDFYDEMASAPMNWSWMTGSALANACVMPERKWSMPARCCWNRKAMYAA